MGTAYFIDVPTGRAESLQRRGRLLQIGQCPTATFYATVGAQEGLYTTVDGLAHMLTLLMSTAVPLDMLSALEWSCAQGSLSDYCLVSVLRSFTAITLRLDKWKSADVDERGAFIEVSHLFKLQEQALIVDGVIDP